MAILGFLFSANNVIEEDNVEPKCWSNFAMHEFVNIC